MRQAAESMIRRALLASGTPIDGEAVRRAAERGGVVVDDLGVAAITANLAADLRGFGPLEPLLTDPQVTDIVVNGPGEIWVDRGDGMSLTPICFSDGEAVRRFAQRLASSCGARLDDACPFVDASLTDGVRLHAMLPPLVDRISVALRIPRHRTWSLDDLVSSGMVSTAAGTVLRTMVRERQAFLISGGTGSGKTTLLNALLGEVDSTERIVIVEDTRELAPQHPHVVSLQTRAANIEGAGAVRMHDLVRQTLRMRPDRLVVGEVRGAEVIDLLTALNTGHRGGCGTVHANSASDVLPRLEVLGALGGIRRDALQRLVASALQCVVHLERDRTGRRHVATLGVFTELQGRVGVELAFAVGGDGSLEPLSAARQWDRLVGAA